MRFQRALRLLLAGCLVSTPIGGFASGIRPSVNATLLRPPAASLFENEALQPLSAFVPGQGLTHKLASQTDHFLSRDIHPPPTLAVIPSTAWGRLFLATNLVFARVSSWSDVEALFQEWEIKIMSDVYPAVKNLVQAKDLSGLRELLALTIAPEQETRVFFIEPLMRFISMLGRLRFLNEESVRMTVEEIMRESMVLPAVMLHDLAFVNGVSRLVKLDLQDRAALSSEMMSWGKELREFMVDCALLRLTSAEKMLRILEDICREIVRRHREYNEKVLRGEEGYQDRPFATAWKAVAPFSRAA
jgi:hypothetical protein